MARLSWNDGIYCGECTDIIQPLFAIGMKIPKSMCPPSCCVSAGCLDVHFVSPVSVPSSWERRAPARLQKPRWSVALPEKTLENWQWIYETDIYRCVAVPV